MSPTLEGDGRRLRELAEFLRLRRARLDPAAVGLPVRARRRTPGLRREDVAERAGVSVAWYTSLEQGRPVSPSLRVVVALADALQLSDADRQHLHTLTGHPPPQPTDGSADTVLLQQLVDHLDVPAYCTDALTNVIAWNPLAAEVFGDYGRWPAGRRTLLRLLFEEPAFAGRLVDRDEYAARVVQTFRGRSGAYLEDPVAIALVDDLVREHPRFARLWGAHTVRRTDSDTLEVDHPVGRLTLTLVNLQGVATPGTRFNAYLPADGVTASRLRAALPPRVGTDAASGS
ncbi:helix-turn-helix transcriptional regulator [Kineosporia sp. R_H_3]|uniref:helix-turn-helix transcriptional regulator n=1 Tax=Kineosporia sp. R_H_3 TaxID=1961848 RepID=UPI0013046E54|nr:helix-turn-helix transcriptional regulator [Kineosporia sp. R_H_3]